MSKLTDDQRQMKWREGNIRYTEAKILAATEPLLQRIAELEQRNSDLHEDVQRFKKHALNEKAARLELERQLEEARKDAERLDGLDGLLQGGTLTIRTANFLSAASRVQITYGEEDPIGDSFDIRAAIDAAMQKGKS